MSVRQDGDLIRLEGECRLEEAEPLALLLQQSMGRLVDLSECHAMHSAVAQVLLSHDVRITKAPVDPFLRDFIFSSVGQPRVVVEG